MHRTGRRLPALALLLAGLFTAAVVTSGPAGAHDELASSTPDDATTVTAPTQVVLRFGEPVLTLGLVVAVTGPGGDAGSGRPEVAGARVTQALRSPAAPGRYTTVWRAVSSDSHPVSGTFTFTVAGPTTPTTTSAASSPTTPAPTSPAASAGGTTDGTVGAAPEASGGGRGLAIAGGALALLLAAATLATRRARR